MFTYVHSHTTDTWPAVPLGLVLVVGTASLQDGLINTATTSNHTFNGRCRCGQIVHWCNNVVVKLYNKALRETDAEVLKQMIMAAHLWSLPTTALLADAMTFLAPDGSLTLDFLVSGLWEITVA